MKTLQELLALRNQRAERLKALIAIMEGANGGTARSLTETEQSELTEIRTGADTLDVQIRNAEFLTKQKADMAAKEFEARVPQAHDPGESTDKELRNLQKRYSVTRAAQYVAGLTVDAGAEREAHQEALKAARAIDLPVTGKGLMVPEWAERATAATALDAGNLIGTNQTAVMDGYKKELWVEKLGATMMMNLTGINNIPVADFTATSAFIGEGSSMTAVTSNVRRPSLVAKGLMSKLTNSWFLRAQAGSVSDQILFKVLNTADENALNTNLILRANSNSSHGIFGAADITDVSGASGTALSRDLLVTMLNTPDKNDAKYDTAGWLLSPTVREALMNMKTDAGSGKFVWPEEVADRLLGYQAAVTSLVPITLSKGGLSGTGKGIAYGYWDQLIVANWAMKEIIVDTASSDTGVVLKTVSFWDWAFMNPKAFAIAYLT